MNNIEEILKKYTRIVDEEQGVGEYMKNKMIEELSNLLTQQREEAVRGFARWIFECPLHRDAEDDWTSDFLEEYLSQQREKENKDE